MKTKLPKYLSEAEFDGHLAIGYVKTDAGFITKMSIRGKKDDVIRAFIAEMVKDENSARKHIYEILGSVLLTFQKNLLGNEGEKLDC
jgi:hypothetical protein